MNGKFSFYHRLRVRYSEIDGAKIVYNAHYLTYVDIAVTEYFRDMLGDLWQFDYEGAFDIVLRSCSFDFNRPAILDDWLDIGCRIEKIGNSSVTVQFAITREAEKESPILTAAIVYVNSSGGKSKRIPDEVREKLVSYEVARGNMIAS